MGSIATEDHLSPSITANTLGDDIGRRWKRFPGALWMARPKRTPVAFMSHGEARRAKISQ
jgi:hypothetical protein